MKVNLHEVSETSIIHASFFASAERFSWTNSKHVSLHTSLCNWGACCGFSTKVNIVPAGCSELSRATSSRGSTEPHKLRNRSSFQKKYAPSKRLGTNCGIRTAFRSPLEEHAIHDDSALAHTCYQFCQCVQHGGGCHWYRFNIAAQIDNQAASFNGTRKHKHTTHIFLT